MKKLQIWRRGFKKGVKCQRLLWMVTNDVRLPPLSKSIGYAQSDTKRTKRRTTGNLLVNLLLSQRGKEFLSLENQEQKKPSKRAPVVLGVVFVLQCVSREKKTQVFIVTLWFLCINEVETLFSWLRYYVKVFSNPTKKQREFKNNQPDNFEKKMIERYK